MLLVFQAVSAGLGKMPNLLSHSSEVVADKVTSDSGRLSRDRVLIAYFSTVDLRERPYLRPRHISKQRSCSIVSLAAQKTLEVWHCPCRWLRCAVPDHTHHHCHPTTLSYAMAPSFSGKRWSHGEGTYFELH